MQRLRHEADALLTGIGTVLADDPRLTDRTGEPRRRKLLRVVVDSQSAHPAEFESREIRRRRPDRFHRRMPTDRAKARALARSRRRSFSRSRARSGHVDLHAQVLRELGRREMLNVLLEAGAELNGAALEAGIVDKMILFYAPRFMGAGGVPMARVSSRSRLRNCRRLRM